MFLDGPRPPCSTESRHNRSYLASLLYEESVTTIYKYLLQRRKVFHSSTARRLGVKSAGALLLIGDCSGVGVARAAASRIDGNNFVEISCLTAAAGDGEDEKMFASQVEEARLGKKVVILTDMEVLTGAIGVGAVVRLVEEEGVGVIGVCGRRGVVGGLKRAGRFEKVLRIAGGTLRGRERSWKEILDRLKVGNLSIEETQKENPEWKGRNFHSRDMDSLPLKDNDASLTTPIRKMSVNARLGLLSIAKDTKASHPGVLGELLAEGSPGIGLHDLHTICSRALLKCHLDGVQTEYTLQDDTGPRSDFLNKDPVSCSAKDRYGSEKMVACLFRVLGEFSLSRTRSIYNIPFRRPSPLDCNKKTFDFLCKTLKDLRYNKSTFKRLNISAPKVVLLHGPPGAGKSQILRHLRKNLSPRPYNWMIVSPVVLYSKWLGESEANLREVFAIAKSLAPCVIQFEEFEEISRQRKEGGLEGRMVGVLLKELDHLGEDVVVIVCVRDMGKLDRAVTRAGRVDQVVNVSFLNRLEVQMMLTSMMSRMRVSVESANWVSEISEVMAGWTAGEVDRVARKAFLMALREYFERRRSQSPTQNMVAVEPKYYERAAEAARQERGKREQIHGATWR